MSKIENLISKMTDNFTRNYLEIDNVFLGFEDYSTNGYILMSFVKKLYDEEKCLLAIQTLFHYGVDPNYKDTKGNNFIQVALETGYSEEFIIKAAAMPLNKGLDVNNKNIDEQTILDSALNSENYKGGIVNLGALLGIFGYDFNAVDFFGNDIVTSLDMFGRKEDSNALAVIRNYFEEFRAKQTGDVEINEETVRNVETELNRILKPKTQK